MRYCSRCVYPENAKPALLIDDENVCSGCRTSESKVDNINWEDREIALREILASYKKRAQEERNPYDCIIPISGGKDSHYQVYLAKVVYGMNPLLVCYNHGWNTQIGVRNLRNLVKQFGCDLIRCTHNLDSVKKIARYMLEKVGDITWHYHTGIHTFPFQIAVKYNIPLILWGEHGWSEVMGMFRLEDIPEFTKWCRKEHAMRSVDIDDLLEADRGITLHDVGPLIFPEDSEIERVGVRGIYLGNYIRWGGNELATFLNEEYDFKFMSRKRDRTFSMFHKTDDHANAVHDYLKYLKFGYGRGTDLASFEIRAGRMTREEGIELVREYDHVRPRSLDVYLDFLDVTEDEFEASIENMRDPLIWEKKDGVWQVKDSVCNHIEDSSVEASRLPLVEPEERTFGELNKSMYYSKNFVPSVVDDTYVGCSDDEFLVL